jgi:release factor glutamine methyltransferase
MSNGNEKSQAWTIGRLLDWTTAWFRERDVEGGRLAAELLLARALGCRKIELYTRFEQEPPEPQRTAFRELVKLAGQHTPIAYLLGSREFFSLEFNVSPAVLIPRPETEALVQRVIDLAREWRERTVHVLDLGTGSGCVAISIAKYASNTQVVAVDVSAEALAVAGSNVERHGLSDRVRLVEADWLALPKEVVPPSGFDVIATNPPYISAAIFEGLPPNVRDHEPQLALTPGGDGLEMFRKLAADAPAVLAPEGRLLTEIAFDQKDAVVQIFAAAGGWTYVGSHRERTDPHERVLEFAVAR